MRESILDRCSGFKPQYICRTASGGAHLLWKLAEPFPLLRNDLTAKLMHYIKKKLKLSKMLVGLDSDAFGETCIYYEAGTDWFHLSDDIIPSAYMMQWAIESADNYKWNKLGIAIPMEIVTEEVGRQYPGRWEGEFHLGARGICFWDPASANATSRCFALLPNLVLRLKSHNEGANKHTAKFKPRFLECYIAFASRDKAAEFERYLKHGSGYAFAKRHL